MSIDEDAARIALLALGATIPKWEALDDRRVRIEPVNAILSVDAATRFLASMPKPLICTAEALNGTLVVECELVAEAAVLDQRIFEERQKNEEAGGGPLSEIVEREGDGDVPVAVVGKADSIVVPLAAARSWSRDYEIPYSICRVDDAHPPTRTRTAGAKGVLRFSSHADYVETMDGRRFAFPLPKGASNEERDGLERGLIGIAKALLFVIDEEEELATVERGLVERGELPADSVSGRGRDRDVYLHRVLASQMSHFFAGRAMPPEVAAFVDACRRE